MSQYPGPDPDDPFAKPPTEGRPPAEAGTDETAPIQREEIGYWERKAQEQQTQAATPSPEAGPSDPTTYPPPSPAPYGQQSGQGYGQGYGQPYGQQQYGQQYGETPGQPAYPPAAYGQPYGYAYQAPPNHPRSTTALVLGLVGLVGGFVTCGLLFLVSPFAWVVSSRCRKEIAASNGQLGGGSNAQAGYIMGIIGTVLLVLAIIAIVVIIVVAIAADPSGTTSTEF